MPNYRIIKYNPANVDKNNNIISDEWISFSDIGKKMDNTVLTFEAYKKIEKAYIDTILNLMNYNGITELTIKGIEKYDENIEWNSDDDFSSKEAVELFKRLENGMTITAGTLEKVCKLILREYFWCKLEYKDIFYVHFGFDYYMYIGCQNVSRDFSKEVRDRGIYADEFESPYISLTLE